MWDESLIESGKSKKEKKRWLSVPASMIFHVALVFALVSVSYWTIDAIPVVPLPVTFYGAVAPPPPAGVIQGRTATKSQATKPATTPTQQQVPNLDPNQNLPKPNSGADDGVNVEAHGIPGGVPGSIDELIANNIIGFNPGDQTPEPPPVPVTHEMTLPVLIHKVEPVYPPIARAAHVQGVVILQAVITPGGSVEDVQVLRSDSALLDPAAVKAVLQWEYKPATLKGRPLKVYFTVTVRFILH